MGKKIVNVWGRALLLLATLLAAGGAAAQSYGSGDFGVGNVRRSNQVIEATVVHVAEANLNIEAAPTTRVVGGAIGGAMCAYGTRNASSWLLRGAATTACAAVGERVGNAFGAERREAVEVVVRTPNGSLISIAQEGYTSDFRVGDKVFVMKGSGVERVVKAGQ